MVNDGVETIYLNSYGQNQDEVPAELVQFLNYVKDIGRIDTSSNTDPFVRNIEKKIDILLLANGRNNINIIKKYNISPTIENIEKYN